MAVESAWDVEPRNPGRLRAWLGLVLWIVGVGVMAWAGSYGAWRSCAYERDTGEWLMWMGFGLLGALSTMVAVAGAELLLAAKRRAGSRLLLPPWVAFSTVIVLAVAALAVALVIGATDVCSLRPWWESSGVRLGG